MLSPVPDCDTPTAAPLGPTACEMPARRKLCAQGRKRALHLTWQLYLSCHAQQGIPQIQWGSSLRKELHMVKWTYKMVEIYRFRILPRLLWWLSVGSEPKPLIAHRFGWHMKSGSTSKICIWLISSYRHGVLWFYFYSRGTFSCMPCSRQKRWGSLCDLYSR